MRRIILLNNKDGGRICKIVVRFVLNNMFLSNVEINK